MNIDTTFVIFIEIVKNPFLFSRWKRNEHMADDGVRKKKRGDLHKAYHSATIYIYGPQF